jgi:hypothetical protein
MLRRYTYASQYSNSAFAPEACMLARHRASPNCEIEFSALGILRVQRCTSPFPPARVFYSRWRRYFLSHNDPCKDRTIADIGVGFDRCFPTSWKHDNYCFIAKSRRRWRRFRSPNAEYSVSWDGSWVRFLLSPSREEGRATVPAINGGREVFDKTPLSVGPANYS